MKKIEDFIKHFKERINKAIDEGDIFRANEIDANLLLGHVVMIMEVLAIICLLFNELGIFTANIKAMRLTILAMLLIETPIMVINDKLHGDNNWLKGLLIGGLLAVCTLLTAILGHNVSFLMMIPTLCSLRYCDAVFTKKVVLFSFIMLALSTLGNAFFGIVNLNVYQVKEATTITIINKIRSALDLSNIDHWNYFFKAVVNDLLPKYMVFSIVAFASIKIAEKGRDLTDMQDKITKKTQRLETELTLATEIQASMLPCIFPAFPEHNELDLFAINYPAKEVGGDFYDYFIIDNNHIAIVMADVSGKGVGAALFMTISKIVLKNQLMSTLDPALALSNTNKQLCENNDAELFVTCWAGIYDTQTNILTFANAGHNPPIVIRQNESPIYLVTRAGLVLAGLETSKYTDCTIKLKQGDEIILYTDGVTEANDNEKNLYGEGRFIKLVEELKEGSAMDQVYGIMDDLSSYMGESEQFDDITVMVMKVKEK